MPSSSLVEVEVEVGVEVGVGIEVGVEVRSKLYQQVFTFAVGWVGGGGVEKWRLKLNSAKV